MAGGRSRFHCLPEGAEPAGSEQRGSDPRRPAMRVTVDANLFTSRYLEEDVFHEPALAFFEFCERREVTLLVPVILLGEVAGAISRIRGQPRDAEAALR